MFTLLISAFVLGLVFNATPGAVFAETVRQGVRGGFRPALAVQIGSLFGDAVWALLGLCGVGILLQLEAVRLPVATTGLAYLLWLAWDAWRAAARNRALPEGKPLHAEKRAFRAGVALSITNPQNVAYWAALGGMLGVIGAAQPDLTAYALFFTGFMGSSIVWAFVCAALVDRAFRHASPGWIRLTYRVGAIGFLLLAWMPVWKLWEAASARMDRERIPVRGSVKAIESPTHV